MNKDGTSDLDTITISDSEDITSINLSDLTLPAFDTIDMSSVTYHSSTLSNNHYTISTANPNLNIGPSYSFSNNWNTTQPSISVKGDASFDGDITWKGRNLGEMLEKIESRLAILTPDPKKLEHFEALKRAYENYKTLERLCQLEENDDKQQ